MSAFRIDTKVPKILQKKAFRVSKSAFLNNKNFEEITDNKLLNSALFYASLGYPVFPLHNLIIDGKNVRCSCRDWRNCERIAKHPRTRNGHSDATTSIEKIKEWWTSYPNANIGIPTGFQTKLLVLDIDIKSGGELSLEYLQEDYKIILKDKYEPLPAPLTVITGSGGRHFYFNYPSDLKTISSSASEIAYGLDIRANGGYVVAPPSQHSSGNFYRWFGVNTPIKDAPNWLIYEIIKSENRKPTLTNSSKINELADGEKILEGKRNTYLFRQASGLVNNYPKEEILRRIFQKNDTMLDDPLSEEEVIRMVNDVCKRYGKSLQNRQKDESL